jgi:hypothetical protein
MKQATAYRRGRSISMAISELRRFFDQFSDRPDVIFKTACHRWRFRLQLHLNSAEEENKGVILLYL